MNEIIRQLSKEYESEIEAIDIYSIMLSLDIPDDIKNVVEEIISDEKDHLVLLSKLIAKYTAEKFPKNGHEEIKGLDEDFKLFD